MKAIEKVFLVVIFCWVVLENAIVNYLRAIYYEGVYYSLPYLIMSSLTIVVPLFIPVWVELLSKGYFMEYYGLQFRKGMITWIVLVVVVLGVMGFILDPSKAAPQDEWRIVEKYYTGYLPSSIAKVIAEQYSPIHAVLLSFIVIVPGAFVEELWFRGFIQFKISSIKILGATSIPTAILTQSIVFGLAHIYPMLLNPYLPALKTLIFLYAMLGGLVLGVVTYRFKSILPAWIAHTLGNFIVVISLIRFI